MFESSVCSFNFFPSGKGKGERGRDSPGHVIWIWKVLLWRQRVVRINDNQLAGISPSFNYFIYASIRRDGGICRLESWLIQGEELTITQFQHGSASVHVPDEHRMLQVTEQGLFKTFHIMEINNDNEYQKTGGKITRAQLHWFMCFYSSCIKFTEPANWLTKELNRVLDAKEPFFVALAYPREKYDPVKVVARVFGFHLQDSYKLENVRKILTDFEDQIYVSGLTNLESILIDEVCEGLRYRKDRNGACHYISPRTTGLMELMDCLILQLQRSSKSY